MSQVSGYPDQVGLAHKKRGKSWVGLFFIWAKKFEFGPVKNGRDQVKSENFGLF